MTPYDSDPDRELRRQRARTTAAELGFRDPDDVVHRLDDDTLQRAAAVKKALSKLAAKKPYLLKEGAERGEGAERAAPQQRSDSDLERLAAAKATGFINPRQRIALGLAEHARTSGKPKQP